MTPNRQSSRLSCHGGHIMKRYWLIAALAVSAGPVEAATVYLRNGTQIQGTIVSATAGDVQVHTNSGTQSLSTDQIERIDYAGVAPASADSTSQPSVVLRNRRYNELYREQAYGKQLFSLGFGAGIPLSRIDFRETGGGSDINGNSGLLIGTQYFYSLTPHLAAGMNMEYINRAPRDSQSLLPESDTAVSGDSLLLIPTLKFSLVDRGDVRPYLLAGIGANRTSTVVESSPNPGFEWSDTHTAETRTLVDDAKWGVASTLRVGVDFDVMNPSVFSFECGWTRLSNATFGATPAGQALGLSSITGNQNVMTIAARWGWKF